MALKAIVDTLEELPEALRGEYEEHEGKYRLTVDNVEPLASSLKKNADQLLKEKKTLKEKLDALKPFEGMDLERVQKALALLEDDDSDDPEPNKDKKKGDRSEFEKLKAKLVADHTKVLGEKDSEITRLNTELRKYTLDLKVKEAALKAGIRPERVDYVLRITGERFDLDDKGNPVVLDADGDPTSMALETFFKDSWKSGNEDFYVGQNAGGSGAQAGAKGGPRGVDLSKLPPAERLKEARRQERAKA